MKAKNTAESFICEIQEQMRYESSTDISTFNLSHPVTCFLRKKNGESSLSMFSHSYYILDINNHGILAVLTNTTPKKYQFFNFSDLQGIKIKWGILGLLLTLQFKNGTRYVFQMGKKNTRFYPNQRRNVDHLISVLNGQNLTIMKNSLFRREVITNRLYAILYIVTLSIPEFIILDYYVPDKFDHTFFIVLLVILIAIVHLILCIAISLLARILHRKKDKDFLIEYNKALKSYEETKNGEDLLKNLQEIVYIPKTRGVKNYYYLTMSTALLQNNRKEEALAYLDKIQVRDIDMQKTVEKQRKTIKEL